MAWHERKNKQFILHPQDTASGDAENGALLERSRARASLRTSGLANLRLEIAGVSDSVELRGCSNCAITGETAVCLRARRTAASPTAQNLLPSLAPML